MTVPDQTPQNVHTANGATTTFAYQFKILDTDHLEVYLDDVLQTSGYTVTGEGVNAGGTVVFTTAPAADTEVILMRSMTIERTAYDYQNAGDFLAATVNEDFDAAIMIAQQINNTVEQRALLFPKTLDRSSNTNALPEPEEGRVLYWASGEIQNALISSLATNPTFASELRTFDTMAQAIADATLEETNVLLVAELGNALLDLSSSGTADGYRVRSLTASGLYATLRTSGELIFAKHWGVKDGVNSTAALQAAIDYAESLNTGGGYGYEFTPTVVLPPGRMIITAEIALDDTKHIAIHGAGMTATVFDCSTSAAFRSVFYSGANQSTFNRFKGFAIHGGSDIQYGIYGPFVDHVIYEDVRISGTNTGAIFHKYGWSSDFINLEVAYNNGHGLIVTDNGNAVNITGCKIYQNDGFGIWSNQNIKLNVFGGTIENNASGGIMLNITRGFDISTYFEGNGSTGYTYTTPAITVNADVILNESGSPETNLAAGGQTNGTFTACTSSPTDSSQCIVFAASCDAVMVNGWHVNDASLTTNRPFIKTLVNSSYGGANDVILNNVTSINGRVKARIEAADISAPKFSSWAHSHSYLQLPKFDLGATHGANPAAYSNAGSSSTALTFAALSTFRNGVGTFSATQAGAGSSHIYAFSIPNSDIEDYDDQLFYVTMWVKAVTGTPGFSIYADTGSGSILSMGTDGALTNGVWTQRTCVFKGNGSGTMRIGVRQFNGNASDVVHFTRPVVSLIGVHANNFGVGF